MAIFGKNKKESAAQGQLPADEGLILPVHVGIIMDGNGRWAKKRGLPRKAGHREGAKTFRTITRYCSEIGIKYLTVYAFSTENWKRPEDEVGALMGLFKSYLKEAIEDFKDDDIIVRFIGDKSGFSPELQELMAENEESSAHRDGMVLVPPLPPSSTSVPSMDRARDSRVPHTPFPPPNFVLSSGRRTPSSP